MKFRPLVSNQAQTILNILQQYEGYILALKDVTVQIKHFDNCREQGYVLELQSIGYKYIDDDKTFFIAFAEHRNSDNIVIYWDKGYHYEGVHKVSDEFWTQNTKRFPYGQYQDAADFILNKLVEHVTTLQEKQPQEV